MDAFTAIRNGLLEHIRQGRFCPSDLGVYIFLHLTADWSTGICKTCAASVATQFNDPSLKELIQKCLRRLRSDGYINYRKGNGQRGSYSILIHKYEPTVGALCGMRLNAFTLGSLDKPIYEPKNGGDTVETRSGHGRDTVPHTVETPLLDKQDVLDVQDRKTKSKKPSRSDERVPDPRHDPIREHIQKRHAEANGMRLEVVPWDGAEGTALKKFLETNPKLTVEEALRCVENYYESDLNISERPRKWIPTMLAYWSSDLNQYGKPRWADKEYVRETEMRMEANVGRH